jgi:hypothetical protein
VFLWTIKNALKEKYCVDRKYSSMRAIRSATFLPEDLKEIGHLGDMGVDGKVMLR